MVGERRLQRGRDSATLVRAELRNFRCGGAAHGPFTEVSRGRWMLGAPIGDQAQRLSTIEMLEYMQRVHKNTRVRAPSQ